MTSPSFTTSQILSISQEIKDIQDVLSDIAGSITESQSDADFSVVKDDSHKSIMQFYDDAVKTWELEMTAMIGFVVSLQLDESMVSDALDLEPPLYPDDTPPGTHIVPPPEAWPPPISPQDVPSATDDLFRALRGSLPSDTTDNERKRLGEERTTIASLLAIPESTRSSDPSTPALISSWTSQLNDQKTRLQEQQSSISSEILLGDVDGALNSSSLSNSSSALTAAQQSESDVDSTLPLAVLTVLDSTLNARDAQALSRINFIDTVRTVGVDQLNDSLSALYNKRYFWLASRVSLTGTGFLKLLSQESIDSLLQEQISLGNQMTTLIGTLGDESTSIVNPSSSDIHVLRIDHFADGGFVLLDEGGANEEIVGFSGRDIPGSKLTGITAVINTHPTGTTIRQTTI